MEMNNELLLRHAIKGGSIETVKRCISEGIPLVRIFVFLLLEWDPDSANETHNRNCAMT